MSCAAPASEAPPAPMPEPASEASAPAQATSGGEAGEERACTDDPAWVPPSGSVRVPGTGVALVPPDGFEVAASYSGFAHVERGATIHVVEVEGASLEEISAAFRPSYEGARPLSVRGMEEVRVGGACGVLVQAEQWESGVRFLKWVTILSTVDGVAIATATFAAEDETLSAPLRDAVLSIHPSAERPSDLFEGLSYRVEVVEPFGPPTRMLNAVSFAPLQEREGFTNPVLIIASSLRPTEGDDRCRRLMLSRSELEEGSVDEVTSVTLAGVSGCRAIGRGVTRRGAEVTLYELVLDLFEGHYLRLSGTAPASERDEWIPAFDRLAATLRLVDAP